MRQSAEESVRQNIRPRFTGRRAEIIAVVASGETAKALADLLREESYGSLHCGTGQEGIHAFHQSRPIAVFLDWVLPDIPGIEVCRSLRGQDPLLPILFVSARDDEASVSRGLNAGADDFIIKPFRHRELIARLEAHLRKASVIVARQSEPEAPRRLVRLGEVEVDLAAREVRAAGEPLRLGMLEFKLLEYMCRNPGIALSREQIVNEVYGYGADISTERVDVLLRRLRAKLGQGPRRGEQLTAVPGYGYRLERRRGERVSESV